MHSIIKELILCGVFGVSFPSVQFVQFLLAFSSLVEQVATNVDDMEHREWLEMGFQHSQ